jgi:glycerate-2-kinase
MLNTCSDLSEDDLVLVIVSGGGSAMLCGSLDECEQGISLYRDAIRTGMSIHELNTVRKHLSSLKGGGLARHLWPARVIGLIFSDVPGAAHGMVASGPTWPDPSTAAEARSILDHYGLSEYRLNETPKDPKYFKRVTNSVLVSNRVALEAMAQKAHMLGYNDRIMTDELYDEPERTIRKLQEISSDKSVVLAGGEFRITVPNEGKGGRNTRATLTALRTVSDDAVFVSFASDGLDNTDAAGAIADVLTKQKAKNAGLSPESFLKSYNDYVFFERTGDLIFTGPTGANVSDLMLLLTH